MVLTDLDKELIEGEMRRFNMKYMEGLELTSDFIDRLFASYDLFEWTVCWYDSPPKECDNCSYDISCLECEPLKKWSGSREQLSYNNWIDVYGPGYWGWNQSKSNLTAKEFFNTILESDTENKLWIGEKRGYLNIYFYDRPEFASDQWFVFKRATNTRDYLNWRKVRAYG